MDFYSLSLLFYVFLFPWAKNNDAHTILLNQTKVEFLATGYNAIFCFLMGLRSGECLCLEINVEKQIL